MSAHRPPQCGHIAFRSAAEPRPRGRSGGLAGADRLYSPAFEKAPPDTIVSKQDSQFFNVFSVVLGILVAVALVLMGVARAVGANTQVPQVHSDPKYVAGVETRIKSFARVAVAGQDNRALTIESPVGAAEGSGSALPELPADGEGVYKAVCTACHGAGIGGAPKSGDKAAWAPRIAQGQATLYKHALEGFTGKGGVMPAKGGRTDATDAQIQAAVDYLVGQAK